MNGTKISTVKLIGLLFAGAAVCAAAPDYFPLQVGNSWVYRVTQGRLSRPGTINVEARETVDGREYFRVQFFEDTLYLRQMGDGSIYKYDREAKTEGLWLPFGSPAGQAVRTVFDDCSRTATVESTNAGLKVPFGDFDNALLIKYTPNCADAGLTVQYFLPYVGLALFETASIAGPVQYVLTYSRTGVTNIANESNAFTLSTDSPTYKAGTRQITVRVTLRVSQPITLTFPSGQSTDMRITNDKGEHVYTWSADKLFAMVFRQERVEGERTYVMEAPIENFAPGKYYIEGWLTTQLRQYSGNVTFEIVR